MWRLQTDGRATRFPARNVRGSAFPRRQGIANVVAKFDGFWCQQSSPPPLIRWSSDGTILRFRGVRGGAVSRKLFQRNRLHVIHGTSPSRESLPIIQPNQLNGPGFQGATYPILCPSYPPGRSSTSRESTATRTRHPEPVAIGCRWHDRERGSGPSHPDERHQRLRADRIGGITSRGTSISSSRLAVGGWHLCPK